MSDCTVSTTIYRRKDEVSDMAFLSKGDLRDLDRYRYDCPKLIPDEYITAETLWTKEPLDFDNVYVCVYIFRAYTYVSAPDGDGPMHTRMTDWYLSKEEAYARLKELFPDITDDDVYFKILSLHTPENTPLQLPCEGILEFGSKGLFLRLETNPMENGSRNKGKFFFPDKKCTSLCPGPVIITSIKEKETYGFFEGHMAQYQTPDEEKLANYLLDLRESYERSSNWTFNLEKPLYFYTSPHFGKFIRFDDQFLTAKPDGDIAFNSKLYYVPDEFLGTCTEKISCGDFLCQGFQHCMLDEFRQKFDVLPYETVRKLYDMGAVNSVKFISEPFDDAIQANAIRLRKAGNILFAELGSAFYIAAYLSEEEAASVISDFNRINAEAKSQILSRRKKGKI